MEPNSIYTTPECSAWSRDFDYANYLSLHAAWCTVSTPVAESTYLLLRKAFDNQMQIDFALARDL